MDHPAPIAGPGAVEPSYDQDVRPILNRNCTSCHQLPVQSSGLDLTTYARFQAGGARGAAFVAGCPEESLAVKFITVAGEAVHAALGARASSRGY
jgi:hypothetical protein